MKIGETQRIVGLDALSAYAADFAAHVFSAKNTTGATLVALSGDLGAGKTAFTKAFAKVIGIDEGISSPTFVIEKIYKIPPESSFAQAFTHLIHIDAYRLERAEELTKLGWKDLISDPKNLICIEWPERVAEIIPETAIRLELTFIDEQTREVVCR